MVKLQFAQGQKMGRAASVPMALVEVLQCIWRDSIARLWASQGATAKGRWMNVS